MSCGAASLSEPLKPKPTFCSHCGKSMVVKTTSTASKAAQPSRFVVPDKPTEPESELDPNMTLEYEIEQEAQGRTLTLGDLLESKTAPVQIEKRPLRDPAVTLKEFLKGQENVKRTDE